MSIVLTLYRCLFLTDKFKENYSALIYSEIMNKGVADFIVKSKIDPQKFLVSYLIAKTIPLKLFPGIRADVCDSVYDSCIRRIQWMTNLD